MNHLKIYPEFTDETAIYNKDQEDKYLLSGLLSELGEVASLYKKWIRDENASLDNGKYNSIRSCLISEIGDVLWYSCRLSKKNDVVFSTIFNRAINDCEPEELDFLNGGFDLTFSLLSLVDDLETEINFFSKYRVSDNYGKIEELLYLILLDLERLGEIFNFSIKTSMIDNYNKLKFRKLTDSIKGSGEFRVLNEME